VHDKQNVSMTSCPKQYLTTYRNQWSSSYRANIHTDHCNTYDYL